MTIHTTHANLGRVPNSAPTAKPVRLRVIGSELLCLVAVAVLMSNFVLGTYTRTQTHTVLIIGYFAFTLVSLFLAIRRPDIRWRLAFFVVVDAIAVLIMLYMHAAQGPFDHSHALTPAGLVVPFILLNNAALSSDTRLVGWFSGSVFAGWLAILFAATASSGLSFAEALLNADVHRELGLALSFGAAALAAYVIVRDTADRRDEAVVAHRRRHNLARFFTPTVVDQLADGEALRLERRKIAVMFVDLRGFTSFAESASSEQMRHVLSEFRDIVSDVIVRHGGAVDKYLGDGVMAVFGHPEPREDDDADRALTCALELVEALEGWRRREQAICRPALRAGIGLHTGYAMAGVLEAGCHSEYTVLGDVVNVAQRLQAVSKSVGATLVVSDDLKKAAYSAGAAAHWREAKQVSIPGRTLPLDIAYV